MQRKARRRRTPEGGWAQRGVSAVAAAALLLFALGIVFSMPERPTRPGDLCAVFSEKPDWYEATRETRQRWGVPEAVTLSIIFQESSFRAEVRPGRTWWLGIWPTERPSSAYGFGQILDATWDEYRRSNKRPDARRDRFDDVADFIGWYAVNIERQTGVDRARAGELYLAYHEGPGGYLRGDHRGKPRLQAAARRVDDRARAYQAQYDECGAELEDDSWLPFL